MKVYMVRLFSRNEPEAVFEYNPQGYQSAIKLSRLLTEETIDHVLVYEVELEDAKS